jgi:hypothetical protein
MLPLYQKLIHGTNNYCNTSQDWDWDAEQLHFLSWLFKIQPVLGLRSVGSTAMFYDFYEDKIP